MHKWDFIAVATIEKKYDRTAVPLIDSIRMRLWRGHRGPEW
jgi:hypothetical protein